RGHAQKLAATLAAGPTRAYAEVKAAVSAAWTMTLPETLDAEAAAQARAGATRDHAAAVQAFLAKKRPEFEGRCEHERRSRMGQWGYRKPRSTANRATGSTALVGAARIR